MRRQGRRSALLVAVTGALLVVALGWAGCGGDDDEAAGSGESVTVGVAEFAEIAPVIDAVDSFKAELEKAGYVEGENVEYVVKNAQNQTSNTSLIARQLVQEEPDLIYALGTPVVTALAQQTEEIPILFGAMTDPVGEQVVDSPEHPGRNLSGTSDAVPAERYFDVIEEVLPDVETVGFVGNPAEPNTESSLEDFQAVAGERGVELREASVANTGAIVPALNSLRGEVDVVTFPADSTVFSALKTVIGTAQGLDLPVIATGADTAASGGVAGIGADYSTLGAINGRQAADILDGSVEISDLPVSYPEEEGITVEVNEEAAKEFNIPSSRLPEGAAKPK